MMIKKKSNEDMGAYAAKNVPLELNTIFCIIKSSGIVFIILSAFDLIIWLMKSPKNFEKIAILKI